MKKLLVVLLSLAMATTFIACGNDNVGGEIKNEDSENSADDTPISLGSASGTAYENEFTGIGWKLLEGWSFATEEQMEQMNAAVIKMLEGDIDTNLAEGSVFCDLYAYDITGSNLNIQFEKLSAVNSIVVTEASYAELSLDILKDTFTSMGYSDISVSSTTIKIGDTEHPGIISSCVYEGVTVYQKMGFIKQGQYICIITASSATESVNDTMFSSFYTLEK